MAVKDNLPSTNLGFTDMADTYGVARTADLGTMYKSGTANMFSRRKPIDQPGIDVSDPTGVDGDMSLTIPLWTGTMSSTPPAWSYRRPSGGESSPYRGRDSAGHYRLARAFVTSGKVGTIVFEWSIKTMGDGSSGPIMTLEFTRPANAGNLQPNQIKQHGAYLSDWYWCVLLRSADKMTSYMFVAGEIQLDGITAYSKLGGGGYKIMASLTAEMVDKLKGGDAVFFLWLPTKDIGGLSFDAIQSLKGSGKMVGVYAGRDPGTGDVWLNPVPMTLTRRSGNVMMTEENFNAAWTTGSLGVGGYAAFPVKIAITGGDGSLVNSAAMNWDAVYSPTGVDKAFSATIQTVENPNMRSRSVTLTAYRATYPSASLAPVDDKTTFKIVQAARPMEITFNPKELTISTAIGYVFFDCPSDGQWYVRAITETEAYPVTGGNSVSWIAKLFKVGNTDGQINMSEELPINPTSGYMTGPAYVSVNCMEVNRTGTDRVAYIHLAHSGGYNTLKVTQKAQ